MSQPHQLPFVYESGGWQVDLARRQLRANGVSVPVGDRAFGIMEVLVQAGGALVTKSELMSRVWPNVIVEENTLQVHISALRKALGADRTLLRTASGRGYRMLGNWSVGAGSGRAPELVPDVCPQDDPLAQINMPLTVGAALIGRASDIENVQVLLSAYRTVTLTGPGGIGKTKLALEVARRQLSTGDGGICVVELLSISDPALVPTAVVGALQLQLGGGENSPEAIAHAIGGTRVLIILDNCEHVIDAAANIAETIIRLCPRVTMLATSREELRIEGEYIYAVPPLTVPPPDMEEPSRIRQCSAAQLFLASSTARSADFSERVEDMAAIGALCRRLDGIPLAIEFAAARVATLGVREVAARLDNRFDLLTVGRRTALPRHQTLRATLDWSYDLLSDTERMVLRRLSVFAGPFSLEAAQSVAAGNPAESRQVIGVLADLVAKSLIVAETADAGVNYRLLETTRVYLLTKLASDDDGAAIARRHALYYCKLFEHAESVVSRDPAFEARAAFRGLLPNVRAALEWSFSADGDPQIGTALAAAAAALFQELSLLNECRIWTERSIAALDGRTRGTVREMKLQASLALSLMFAKGNSETVHNAFERGLQLAEQFGDSRHLLPLVVGLHILYIRVGDHSGSLAIARRAMTIAGASHDPLSIAVANGMLGHSEYELGDLIPAQAHLEAALARLPVDGRGNHASFGFDQRTRCLIVLMRTLWLRGRADQAFVVAKQTLAEAETVDHPVSLCISLLHAGMAFLGHGDWTNAEMVIERAISYAARYSLVLFEAVGRGFKGALCLQRGDTAGGIEPLRQCLALLRAERHRLFTPVLSAYFAEGLAAEGQFEEALAFIDGAIADDAGETHYTAELWRVRGRVLASAPVDRSSEAEAWFLRAMEKAREQSALTLELRAALDLSQMRLLQERRGEARDMLAAVYSQFTEGFETADLRAARALLASLHSPEAE